MAAESKHVRKFKEKHLQPGEQVVAWGAGYIGKPMGKGRDAQTLGALIVTPTRAAFYRKGFFGEVLETIPLKSISSIERKSFMGRYSIRLHTSNDALDFTAFKKTQEEALAWAVEDGRSNGPQPAAASVPPGSGDVLSALEKLGELKAAGVLTEDEFNAKKAELLARL
ncbi:MAG: SHOCT domain-containing protein [Pseudomonas farsensis]|uniref:SHOCT domain-containing protein n=1 Tax=Pseudomonas TaxID=286 RepID=UPI00320A1C6F